MAQALAEVNISPKLRKMSFFARKMTCVVTNLKPQEANRGLQTFSENRHARRNSKALMSQ